MFIAAWGHELEPQGDGNGSDAVEVVGGTGEIVGGSVTWGFFPGDSHSFPGFYCFGIRYSHSGSIPVGKSGFWSFMRMNHTTPMLAFVG